MYNIVDVGENHCGDRLITIEIPLGTNLYKHEPDYLPLFAGWSHPSGSTVTSDDIQAIRPARLQEGESVRVYLTRLKEYRDKLANLDQWFLTLRSRNQDEDQVILGQMKALNDLPFGTFLKVTGYSNFEHFPPTPGDKIREHDLSFSEAKVITELLKKLSDNPEQKGPGAIRYQAPGRAPLGALGDLIPPELKGMGFRIQTWNYAFIEVAWDGTAHWIRATFCDEEQECMDLVNPLFFPVWDDAKRSTGQ